MSHSKGYPPPPPQSAAQYAGSVAPYPAGGPAEPPPPPYYAPYPSAGNTGYAASQPPPPSQVIIMSPPSQPSDGGGDGGQFTFSDKSIRLAFIRKVYLILCAQLAVTFGIVLLVSLVPGLRAVALANYWLFHLAYAVFIVVYICMVCFGSLRRKYPWNYVALVVFTTALTFMAAVISARYNTNSVLICLGVTALVCLGVTLFAVQTRIDFTLCSGLLFGLCLVVLLFGLACAFSFAAYRGQGDLLAARILDCVYGGLVALLLVLFLIYDTQRVVGGRQHNLSEEEYVFGALQLYMDVVFIFIIILGLGGDR